MDQWVLDWLFLVVNRFEFRAFHHEYSVLKDVHNLGFLILRGFRKIEYMKFSKC